MIKNQKTKNNRKYIQICIKRHFDRQYNRLFQLTQLIFNSLYFINPLRNVGFTILVQANDEKMYV